MTRISSSVEINYRLRLKGLTQASIAKELSVSAGMVNNVIHNRVTCHRVANHIAALLNESLETLWPGRYEFKPRQRHSKL